MEYLYGSASQVGAVPDAPHWQGQHQGIHHPERLVVPVIDIRPAPLLVGHNV
jgi:hypothetical protein